MVKSGAAASLLWRKERLPEISKRGDAYLRTLLIHGARSVLWRLKSTAVEAKG
jgi:transposase